MAREPGEGRTDETAGRAYLPPEADPAEIRDAAREAVAAGTTDLGRLMGVLMGRFKGKADGKVIISAADVAKQGAPTFDGEGVLWFQDETGDESGRWLVQQFHGGETRAFLDLAGDRAAPRRLKRKDCGGQRCR